MEYLDYYDGEGNFLGSKSREEVHKEGLWHKTIHCWLFDEDNNVYFQIRKDSNTCYTTASGHVLKGETLEDAFAREIKEEIGLDIDASDAIFVDVVPWIMDKMKKDGSIWKDRAVAHVFLDKFEGTIDDFAFDEKEVLGIVKLNAEEVLDLFKEKVDEINGEKIITKENKNIAMIEKINRNDFLLMPGETLLGKYGEVLQKIISLKN